MITLSRDELFVFLTLLGLKSMNGLATAELEEVPEQEKAIRFNSGEATLRQRGLLRTGDTQIVLDDTLVALAGSAALPRSVLLLNRIEPDGSNAPHYFSRGPDLLVEHSSPAAGLFTFQHLADDTQVHERLADLLAPLTAQTQVPSPEVAQVAAGAVADFLGAVQQGRVRAAPELLVGGGCPAALAMRLGQALQQAPFWVGVAGWGLQAEATQGAETLMVVSDGVTCWLLASDNRSQEQVWIRSLSGVAAGAALQALAHALTRP